MDVRQKRGFAGSPNPLVSPQTNGTNRVYGVKSCGSRHGLRGFVPPIRSNGGNTGNVTSRATKGDEALDDSTEKCMNMLCGPDGELPEKPRNLESRLIEHISNEIMARDPNVRWDDIAGLDHAKICVTEMVIYPLLWPNIFKGSPGRGLLLFGPPRKSDGEHESSRRLKTQFLIEMEGFDSGNEQVLLIGATNRPQKLDEAARRLITKQLYIPLPSSGN